MKKKKYLKMLFIIVLLISSYIAFKDSIVPIFNELKKVSFSTLLIICSLSCAYQVIEGINIYCFARKYQKEFKIYEGIIAAFYSSFYKIATFGTGSGVAAIYYLKSKGVPVTKGTAMTTIQYVIHKLTIALYCCICFVIQWEFMGSVYGKYKKYLLFGCLFTIIIATTLILICLSEKLHEFIFAIYARVDKKKKHAERAFKYREELKTLSEETKYLLKSRIDILFMLLRNIIKLSCWYIIPYILLRKNMNVSPLNSSAVTSLMTAIAGVFPSPAGIGSTEILYTLLFGQIAGTIPAASTMLLYRFATFIVPFIIGAVFAVLHKKHNRQS